MCKKCKKCNQEKVLNEFYDNRHKCKDCYQKDYLNRKKDISDSKHRYCNSCLKFCPGINFPFSSKTCNECSNLELSNQRLCCDCQEIKSIKFFHNRRVCSTCQYNRQRAKRKEYLNKNKEKTKQFFKDYRQKNTIKMLLYGAKNRARQKGIEFNLEEKDITIPKFCPVLGIKLEVSKGEATAHSPSIDRIDPNKGYLKDNICIISHRANSLKGNGTIDEHRKIADYIEIQQRTKKDSIEFSQFGDVGPNVG